MSIAEYVWDRILLYLLHAVCMLALFAFLYMTGYPWRYGVLILTCWLLVLGVWTAVTWAGRRRYFQQVGQVLKQVDQRYLLGELMPASGRLEDRIYRDMIRRSNQSVIERIRRIEEERKDYREFIENWVHEVKAPVTAISLICENYKKERAMRCQDGREAERAMEQHGECGVERQDERVMERHGECGVERGDEQKAERAMERIALENERIENCVDVALYYARSDEVYRDYLIRETDLSELVMETIVKNKRYLILNQMRVETDCKHSACTDGKWIAFILTQLLRNSAKYRCRRDAWIRIWTERTKNGVCLYVRDNGIGIAKEDLPRVFEKGFTGHNGRSEAKAGRSGGCGTESATGMGLYLCKKLCEKLGVGIAVESACGERTTVVMEFPVSEYIEAGR